MESPTSWPPVLTGSDVVWTITADGTQYGMEQVSATLQADGAATAPDSWALYGPDGSTQTSRVSGVGAIVTYYPYALFGPWRLVAIKDGAPVATHTTTVLRRTGPGLVADTATVFGA